MKTLIILTMAAMISISAYAKESPTLYYEDDAKSSICPENNATNSEVENQSRGASLHSVSRIESASTNNEYLSAPLTFEEEVLMADLFGNNIHYP